MSEVASMLRELADRVLGDGCTPSARREAETGGWHAILWDALQKSGLPQAGVPESLGGAGAEFSDALVVAEAAGWHALPLPLVETILANWLLAQAQRAPVAGSAGIATTVGELPLLQEQAGAWRLSGSLARVPWGRKVDQLVFLARTPRSSAAVVSLAADATTWRHGRSVADEPRDTTSFDDVPIPASAVTNVPDTLADFFTQAGALARCCQMVGAIDWALARTLEYCNERTQFGKPVGRFQAVQHLLAQLAGEACAARVATRAAQLAFDQPARRESAVASAKSVVGEAAGRTAAICHQVHGAMGYSQEHPLHLRTRRLWSWREEFGSERDWQVRLGRKVCSGGSAMLWPDLAGA